MSTGCPGDCAPILPTPIITVGPCAVGRGVFAGEPIGSGREILRFTGRVLTLRDVRAKHERACDALQIGVDQYLDLEDPGRLVNHSCRPNLGVVADRRLIALRDIVAGEELRFDYSTTISDGWTMTCCCGVAECRGVIAAFQLLPAELQQRYALLGIVQRFILAERGS